MKRTKDKSKPTFVDVFAGCGGLSLGLLQSGWKGLFAVEKDLNAYQTLEANLIAGGTYSYQWPKWLPKEPLAISTVLRTYADELKSLRGRVDLVVGGPPCQGFSSAGRRNVDDPRNVLTAQYLHFVKAVQPKLILLENVRGFTADFCSEESQAKKVNYSERIVKALSQGYVVHSKIIDLSEFGLPQRRRRFFLVGIRKDCKTLMSGDPFEWIAAHRKQFLREKGLPSIVTARSALSDLECVRNGITRALDSGYGSIAYKGPRTSYQRLMRVGAVAAPSDTRLSKHSPEIVRRFGLIISDCKKRGRLATNLDRAQKEKFKLKKAALRVLDPSNVAPTITSLPEDLLHYDEPRTLTVRENARLQGFPDWFEFHGKQTTGGKMRTKEVPRFTQVANAVPPLVAEAIGSALIKEINLRASA